VPVRAFTKSRLAAIVASVWLCFTPPAWAGGGGEDGGAVQPILNSFCALVGVTSCPQLPTVTQVALEISALSNSAPDFVRSQFFGLCTVAGNFGFLPCNAFAVSAANGPVLSDDPPPRPASISLSSLSSLAFTSGQGAPVPVPQGTAGANSFFYAVATGSAGQPNTLDLFFDYLPQANSHFATGTVAKISLPLQVLSGADGSERLVCGAQGCPASLATLELHALCAHAPNCLTGSITGDFGSGQQQSRNAAELGIKFAVSFGPSPNGVPPHALYTVQVPILITGPTNPAACATAMNNGTPDPTDCGNDPAYFGVVPAGATLADGSPNPNIGSPTGINQASGLRTAFTTNVLGFPAGFLGGARVGIAPSAAPACTAGTVCSPAPPSTFPFCASFWQNGVSHPGVAAFFSIGTDGVTYVSSPVGGSPSVTCPL
jgi:hypothetical protein